MLKLASVTDKKKVDKILDQFETFGAGAGSQLNFWNVCDRRVQGKGEI